MRIPISIFLFLILGFCLSCQNYPGVELTKQELEVYRKILGDRPINPVLIDKSKIGMFGEIETKGLLNILTELQSDTFDNFVNTNSIPVNIEETTVSDFGYQLMFGEKAKEKVEFNRAYIFTRVGFSNDGKQAVVMFIDSCEPLCSKGAYYLLSNKNGIWEIQEESENWRS